MVQKDLLLNSLQQQLRETDNEQVILALGSIINDVLAGKLDIKVW